MTQPMSEACDLAELLYELAPWRWMDETMLIAVADPATGRRDHISIMGQAGNHRSLALYLGPEARRRFNLLQEVQDLSDEEYASLILNTRQLQCSFSERSDLYPRELAAIKRAGRSYRGDNWPSFRSFHPGHCPRPVDDDELSLLLNAIRQVLDVSPALASGSFTKRARGKAIQILTRIDRDGAWSSEWTPDDASLFAYPSPLPSEVMVESVRRHEQAVPMDVLFQIIPNPVGKTRESSVYPSLVLVVEPSSGFVLGAELLSTEAQSYEQLIESIPDTFLRICNKHSARPNAISVASPSTHALLAPTAEALGIACIQKSRLPALDAALRSMMGFFGEH